MYENGIAEYFKNYIFGIPMKLYDNFGGFSITKAILSSTKLLFLRSDPQHNF